MDFITQEQPIYCPYCGENISIIIDCSAGNQGYIEDCSVCCRPIFLNIDIDDEGNLVGVTPRREDD